MGIFGKKKKDFIELLCSQAELSLEGIKALHEFINDPSKEKGEKVERLEEEADEMRRVIIDDLLRAFVTSIDREDIFALSRAIDDIVDYAKSTVEEMMLFDVQTDPLLKKMAEGLLNATKDIVCSIKHLKSHPSVCSEHLIRAKKCENFIEHKYREGLVELFKTNDVIKILKTREIYRHMSNAADRAAEAANIISDIMVKVT